MTKIDGLSKRAQRLLDARGVQPVNLIDAPQWITLRATLTQEVACYPEAQAALLPVLARLSGELHTQEDTIHYAIGQALAPYLAARIAISEVLMHGR